MEYHLCAQRLRLLCVSNLMSIYCHNAYYLCLQINTAQSLKLCAKENDYVDRSIVRYEIIMNSNISCMLFKESLQLGLVHQMQVETRPQPNCTTITYTLCQPYRAFPSFVIQPTNAQY